MSYDDDDDDIGETIPCRSCGADVYEDALQCPECGDYVSLSGGGFFAGRPWWFVVLGVLGIVALIYALTS